MRERRYRGESRFRSRTPPPRRLSPPPGRFRDRGYSPPRRRYNMDMEEEEKRGVEPLKRGELSRRDYDKYYEKHDERGGRDYEKNFSRREKLTDRDYGRNFSEGHRSIVRSYSGGGGGTRIPSYNVDHRDDDRSFSRGGGMRISNYKGDDRDGDRSLSRGSGGMRIPNHKGDNGDGDRSFSRGGGATRTPDCIGDDKHGDRSFSRGGGEMRIPYYTGNDGDRGRDYVDRERDKDFGHPQSMYRSSGNREYSQGVYELGAGTSSKFQWDHLLDETRKSDDIKSSIDSGIGGSGIRRDLEYGYQRSKLFDKGRDGLVLDSKSMSGEAERGRDYASSSHHMNVSFPANSSTHADEIGNGMAMSSHCTNNFLKGENYHFGDKLHSQELVSHEPVMRDALGSEAYKDKPLHYSSLDIDYTVSSNRSKAFHQEPLGSFKEDIPSSFRDDLSLPSGGVRMSTEMMTNSIGYNRKVEKPRTRSPLDHEGRSGDSKSYSRSYFGTSDDNSRDYAYPIVGSGERGGTLSRSADSHRKILGIGEDYSHQDMPRLGILDPTWDKGDESSHQGYMRRSRLLDHHYTSSRQSIPDRYYSSDVRKKDIEGQSNGSPQPKYERKFYHGPSSRLGEHNDDHEVASGSVFHHRLSDILPSTEYDPHFADIESRPQEKLMLGNTSLARPFKSSFKRKYAEKGFTEHGSTSYDLGKSDEPRIDIEDGKVFSKGFKFSKPKYGKFKRALDVKARLQSPAGTVSFSSRSDILGSRDIKKRLGPAVPKLHVSQRLVKKYKPSLKKRLGPGLQKNHVTLPWLKNLSASSVPRSQDGSGGSDCHQVEDSQDNNVISAKPEPPENSEDFKQLVKIAFFKFVKQLNDTPAKRRRYKEQGIDGSLKCIVCRSQEEFVGTESLAKHAFTCQKIGLRSGHLGLHKALCALMGWKNADKPTGIWVREMLSEAENLTLKEDLILWPPVVIIHNTTISNKSPDQRVIVSVEELEAKLRDMGFGDKTKVYRGKPANQSVMVVEFAGLLSGLQEAERLHNIYADNNQGRAEFLHIKSHSNGGHGAETEVTRVNKVDDILYGYLGIAEDLDKLDFDAKKHRLVKSKKEIKDIAEAPIKEK